MELESWAGRDVTSTVLAEGLLGSHTHWTSVGLHCFQPVVDDW